MQHSHRDLPTDTSRLWGQYDRRDTKKNVLLLQGDQYYILKFSHDIETCRDIPRIVLEGGDSAHQGSPGLPVRVP